jgi:predicted PurR-regulated permease PerM
LSSFIYSLLGILVPFLIAFTVSFIVNPWVKYLEKKNVNHKLSVFIVILFLISILVIFGVFLVPLINKELSFFIDNFHEFIDKINNLFNNIKFFNKIGLNFKTIVSFLIKSNGNLIDKIIKFVTAIFSSFIPTITTPVLVIYFIVYYEKIENLIKSLVDKNSDTYLILKKIKYSMHVYFKSYLIITVLLSFFSSVAFALLNIEYFLIWGIIIGITNIIPYVGPYIGGGIVGLFVLTTNPELVIYVIIIIVCLQVIESNFLPPKIQGEALEINPILVVFSVTFFGKILGIIGMIIAVPIVRIMQIIIKVKIFNKKR